MKYLIIDAFIFLISFYNCLAQEITIYDKEDNQIIPFVAIVFKVNGIIIDGTHADDSGKVFLALKEEVDSITIFEFGYQVFSIHKKDIQKQIYLQEEAIPLAEVSIVGSKNKKSKIKKMGYPMKYRGLSWVNGYALEMVALIENTLKKEEKVKSFTFRLERCSNFSPIFKVVFYANDNGLVGKPLLKDTQKQIFTLKPNEIKVKLNITNLKITLPKEGFFIGLQHIGYIDNNTKEFIVETKNSRTAVTGICLLKSKHKTAKFVYARTKFNENMKEWSSINDIFNNTRFQLKENEYYVPAFGIEVYE